MEQFKLTPEKMSLFSKIAKRVNEHVAKEHPEYPKLQQKHTESLFKRFLGEWMIENSR